MFDPDEVPTVPTLDPAHLDKLRQILATEGPAAAIETLCTDLRTIGDLDALFYAMLMRKRVELGVSPFPTGPAADLPPETHEAYEDAIRAASSDKAHPKSNPGSCRRGRITATAAQIV